MEPKRGSLRYHWRHDRVDCVLSMIQLGIVFCGVAAVLVAHAAGVVIIRIG